MEKSIFNFLDWLTFACSVALLGSSLFYSWQRHLPIFLKILPGYCLVTVVNEILVMVFPNGQPLNYLLFTIFELLFFSFVLSLISRNTGFIVILWLLNLVFLFIVAQYILRRHKLPFGFPEQLESLILIIGCVICYLQMLTSEDNSNLWQKPGFWMLGGMLLYFIFLMPSLVCSTALIHIGQPNLGKWVFSISNVALLVSYFFYFKSMTCRSIN